MFSCRYICLWERSFVRKSRNTMGYMYKRHYLVRDNCVICQLPLLYLDHTFEMKESTPRTCSACLWCAPSKRKRKEILAKLGCWYSCGSDSLPTESKKAEVCQVNPLHALIWGPHSSVARHVDNKKGIVSSEADQGLLLSTWCVITSSVCPLERLGWLSGSFGVGLYLSVSLTGQALFICLEKEVCLY